MLPCGTYEGMILFIYPMKMSYDNRKEPIKGRLAGLC